MPRSLKSELVCLNRNFRAFRPMRCGLCNGRFSAAGDPNGATFLQASPFSARDYPTRRLALLPVHPQLSGRRGVTGPTGDWRQLRDRPIMGDVPPEQQGRRDRQFPSDPASGEYRTDISAQPDQDGSESSARDGRLGCGALIGGQLEGRHNGRAGDLVEQWTATPVSREAR
jgi:hypothetical protein